MNTSPYAPARVNPIRQRKPLLPVQATGAFVGGATPADLLAGVAVLEITRPEDTEDFYWCALVADRGEVVGYQLRKFATGEVYFLPCDLSSCDCADGTYRPERPGGCKHMQAMKQALLTVGKVEAEAAA